MTMQRSFLLLVMLPAVLAAPASGQTPLATVTETTASGATVPNLSGIWWHPFLPGMEPLASGPTSIRNLSRRNGVSNYDELVGDYRSPILQPWASQVVKKFGELSKAGVTYPSPANQCWPEPVPFIFKTFGMEMLQESDQVTFLYDEGPDVRRVKLNQPHPANV